MLTNLLTAQSPSHVNSCVFAALNPRKPIGLRVCSSVGVVFRRLLAATQCTKLTHVVHEKRAQSGHRCLIVALNVSDQRMLTGLQCKTGTLRHMDPRTNSANANVQGETTTAIARASKFIDPEVSATRVHNKVSSQRLPTRHYRIRTFSSQLHQETRLLKNVHLPEGGRM